MNLNGVEYYYIRNVQGLFNDSGTQVVSYDYDSWRNLLNVTDNSGVIIGTKNPYKYRGYRYDTETGLYYLNSRYYNPEWGRFINADSILGQTGELLSHNMFIYSMNNPINMEDNAGYFPKLVSGICSVLGGVGMIITGIATAAGGGPAGIILGGLLIIHGVANLKSGTAMIANAAFKRNYDESNLVENAYEYYGEEIGGEKGRKVGTVSFYVADTALSVYATKASIDTATESCRQIEKTSIGEGYRYVYSGKKVPYYAKIFNSPYFGLEARNPLYLKAFNMAGLANDVAYTYISEYTGASSAVMQY